jgi:hypothetical protein
MRHRAISRPLQARRTSGRRRRLPSPQRPPHGFRAQPRPRDRAVGDDEYAAAGADPFTECAPLGLLPQ